MPAGDEREEDRDDRARSRTSSDAARRAGAGAGTLLGAARLGRSRSRYVTLGLPRRRSPTISSPIRSAAPGPLSNDADEAPAREHGDPVAELEQLVEVGRDDERRAAARRELADQLAHGRGRLDVEPVGRLVEDDDLRVEATARARAGPSGCCRPRACPRASRRRRAHVELAHERRSPARRSTAALDPAAPPERTLADALEERG